MDVRPFSYLDSFIPYFHREKSALVAPIRFSRQRDPLYNSEFQEEKNFHPAYSGWLKIDFRTARIRILIFEQTEPIFVNIDQTRKVKGAQLYSGRFVDGKIVEVRQKSMIIKRIKLDEPSDDDLQEQYRQLRQHKELRQKLKSHVATAPHAYPVLKRGRVTLLEMHQVRYSGTITSSPDLPLSDKLLALYHAAKGVEKLHRLGWVHGDLKGANILYMIRKNGRIQSRLNDMEWTCLKNTQKNSEDSYFYWDGFNVFTPFTDLYALTMTLGTCLFGTKLENKSKEISRQQLAQFIVGRLQAIMSFSREDLEDPVFCLQRLYLGRENFELRVQQALEYYRWANRILEEEEKIGSLIDKIDARANEFTNDRDHINYLCEQIPSHHSSIRSFRYFTLKLLALEIAWNHRPECVDEIQATPSV